MSTSTTEITGQLLRKAVADAKDQASLDFACRLIYESEDLNAVGKSGKAAINFLVERLLKPILTKEKLDISIYNRRLKLLDYLLIHGATTTLLKHPETHAVIITVSAIYESLLAKFKQGIDLSQRENLILAIFYCFNEKLAVNQRVTVMEKIRIGFFKDEDLALEAKPIIICESHLDPGTLLLIKNLKQPLLSAGFDTLCLEFSYRASIDKIVADFLAKLGQQSQSSATNHIYEKLMFAMQPEFKSKLVFIDPKTDHTANTDNIYLESMSFFLIGFDSAVLLRDKGMLARIAVAAKQQKGRIVVIVGAAHGLNIISGLETFGIPCSVLAPFVNPAKLSLTQTTDGEYVSTEDKSSAMNLLFSRCHARPLNMSDPKTYTEVLPEFATSQLPKLR